MKGPGAKELYNELKEEDNERKRDKKERLKKKVQEMANKEKFAFRRDLASKLEEKYILTCARFLVDPADFVQQEHEEHGDENFLACFKIFEKLETHNRTAQKLQNRNRI